MRLGTRASALALAQAGSVARLLGEETELVPISTRSEALEDEDKGRWVRGLEGALRDGSIDLAVHSAKDVPQELPSGLALVASPPRGAAADALCTRAGRLEDRDGGADAGECSGIAALPVGARIGTSSPRRVAQLRAVREDLDVVAIAGNVDTRLRKLDGDAERLDAIVLACAALERLGLVERTAAVLDPRRFVPAPGQGTLVLEARADDQRARAIAERVNDAETFACLSAERALARALDASCRTPIGAHARVETSAPGGRALLLRAWIGAPDGSRWIGDELRGGISEASELAQSMASRMLAAGAGELLRASREFAVGPG